MLPYLHLDQGSQTRGPARMWPAMHFENFQVFNIYCKLFSLFTGVKDCSTRE